MDYSKPTLLVISGPNGAGKSTHIQTMLPKEFNGIWSFDRDLTRTQFEDQLISEGVSQDDLTRIATIRMEEKLVTKMRLAIQNKQHFVLETPLSHPDYWRYLDLFENNGYQIQLNYLCLDKISDCTARVGQRVLEGGHYVDPDTIRGVYEKNLEHINNFNSTFEIIELYDGMKVPTLLAKLENNHVIWANKTALKKNWIKKGMPEIAQKIQYFIAPKK